ncbi:hypothetical protein ACFXCZ_35130 [Streptomyces sp. NPDC059396]|uniref:hypothetical protein n=1 Tax=Streptomyces sp. NPDC059396 TaxID=3346819 RepID=UPI0036C8DEB5
MRLIGLLLQVGLCVVVFMMDIALITAGQMYRYFPCQVSSHRQILGTRRGRAVAND